MNETMPGIIGNAQEMLAIIMFIIIWRPISVEIILISTEYLFLTKAKNVP